MVYKMDSVKLVLLLSSIHFVCCTVGLKDYTDDKIKQQFQTVRETCLVASGVRDELINGAARGDFRKDPKLKNYLACTWLITDMLDSNFEINFDKLDYFLPPFLTEQQVTHYQSCYNLSKKFGNLISFVDKVWIMTQCNYKADPENFVIF